MKNDSIDSNESHGVFSSQLSKAISGDSLSGCERKQARGASMECVGNSKYSARTGRRSWGDHEKKEFWRQKREERRIKRRKAAAARKVAENAEWIQLTETEKNDRRAIAIKLHEERRRAEELLHETSRQRLNDPKLPVLVFDLSFAWCMTLSDTKSTITQLKYSYSTLRRAGFPFRPVFSSLIGKEKHDTEHDAVEQAKLLQASLIGFEGFNRFPPTITVEQHWSELFDKERIVFLTADADNVLHDIYPDQIYIIGAFVDHNRYKMLSKTHAQAHGVRTARLPIKDSVDLCNRSVVLTINHVVSVLTTYVESKERGSPGWVRAFNSVLPIRRLRQQKLGSRKRRLVQPNCPNISEECEFDTSLQQNRCN